MNFVDKANGIIEARGSNMDSLFHVRFYVMQDKSLLSETDFKDSTLNVFHGKNIEFHTKGNIASISIYNNNLLNGPMQKWNEDGQLTDSIIYNNGSVEYKATYNYINQKPIFQTFIDSLNDTLKEAGFDADGQTVYEVFFHGTKGIYKKYKAGALVSEDSVYSREHTDATYGGKNNSWRRYLERTLNLRNVLANRPTPGTYQAIVQFIVDTDGNISNFKPLSNNGYGIEEEAVRVIRQSGKWIPATRYGIPIKAYRKQPITLVIPNL